MLSDARQNRSPKRIANTKYHKMGQREEQAQKLEHAFHFTRQSATRKDGDPGRKKKDKSL